MKLDASPIYNRVSAIVNELGFVEESVQSIYRFFEDADNFLDEAIGDRFESIREEKEACVSLLDKAATMLEEEPDKHDLDSVKELLREVEQRLREL